MTADDGPILDLDLTLTAVPRVESFIRRLPPLPAIDILLLARDSLGFAEGALRPGVRGCLFPGVNLEELSVTLGPNATLFLEPLEPFDFCKFFDAFAAF